MTLTLIQRLTFIRLACLFATVGFFVASAFIDSIRWVLVGAGVVGIFAYIGLQVATATLRVRQIAEAAGRPRSADPSRDRAAAMQFRVRGGTLLVLGVALIIAGLLLGDVLQLVGVLAGSLSSLMGLLLVSGSVYFSRRAKRPPAVGGADI